MENLFVVSFFSENELLTDGCLEPPLECNQD